MRWLLLTCSLVTVALVAYGCGSGPDRTSLEKALPGLVLGYEDEFVVDPFDEISGEYIPNELFGDAPHWMTGETIGELATAGRINGYSAHFTSYIAGGSAGRSSTVSISLDLYRDDQSASIALGKLPNAYSTEPFVLHDLGDEAIALPLSPENVRPDGGTGTCPCEFGFRAGPIVGFIRVSQPLPEAYGVDGFDSAEKAIARWMVDRIHTVLSSNV